MPEKEEEPDVEYNRISKLDISKGTPVKPLLEVQSKSQKHNETEQLSHKSTEGQEEEQMEDQRNRRASTIYEDTGDEYERNKPNTRRIAGEKEKNFDVESLNSPSVQSENAVQENKPVSDGRENERTLLRH